MEAVILSTTVHGNGCMGCERTKKDIMVTMATPPSEENKARGREMEFNDFFLTTKQAEELVAQLQKRLKENE